MHIHTAPDQSRYAIRARHVSIGMPVEGETVLNIDYDCHGIRRQEGQRPVVAPGEPLRWSESISVADMPQALRNALRTWLDNRAATVAAPRFAAILDPIEDSTNEPD